MFLEVFGPILDGDFESHIKCILGSLHQRQPLWSAAKFLQRQAKSQTNAEIPHKLSHTYIQGCVKRRLGHRVLGSQHTEFDLFRKTILVL